MTAPESLPCTIMRGGTSKAVFLAPADLPESRQEVESILLRTMGSPDIRQIDGLGGATPQTSKVAIVGPSTVDWADVDYTFAQVQVARPLVDWGGNCGNISSAVGPYAFDRGLVEQVDGPVSVRIRNTNTGKLLIAHFDAEHGRAKAEGDYAIAGVLGVGARIDIEFVDPAGTLHNDGVLLPTGNAVDIITLRDGRTAQVSIVDAGNPTVFVYAEFLGLNGSESPDDIARNDEVLQTLEELRAGAAVTLGLARDAEEATLRSPGLPKVAMVSPPASYTTLDGESVNETSIDVLVRSMSMGSPHRAVQITAAVAVGAASVTAGCLVNQVVRPVTTGDRLVRIGHGFGITEVGVAVQPDSGELRSVTVARTARRILDGTVYLPVAVASERGGDPS